MTELKLILHALLKPLNSEFQADIVAVTRNDERSDAFTHYILTQQAAATETMTSPIMHESFAGSVMDSAKPLVVNDVALADFNCPIMQAEGIHSYLGTPLSLDNMCIGVLEIMCKSPRLWSLPDAERAAEYGEMIQAILAPMTGASQSVPLRLH